MKKLVSVLLTIMMLFSLTACGNSTGAVTPAYSSEIHSKEDIETAIDVAKSYFFKEFDGCKLLTITYGGDDILENHREFTESGDIKDVIVLVSDFYVSPNGGDGSLNQNDIYTDWKWIIVKDSNGNWVHKDHGYA
ncbi:MAG: hypothetical protein IJW86_10835 [Clostridia bacterium]|nr:hypothetical protein [Clostridia bacterium]MBQ7296666.1 hypothetical protein [Clostridia bacterium]